MVVAREGVDLMAWTELNYNTAVVADDVSEHSDDWDVSLSEAEEQQLKLVVVHMY